MWKEALSIEKGDELCALVMLTQKRSSSNHGKLTKWIGQILLVSKSKFMPFTLIKNYLYYLCSLKKGLPLTMESYLSG
jgi:hypothetical protein